MRLHKIILLLGILGVIVLQMQTGIASGSISVGDADAVRNFALNTAPSDALDSTGAPHQETFINVYVTGADAARDSNLNTPPDNVLNSTDASQQETFIDVYVNGADATRDSNLNTPPDDVLNSTDASQQETFIDVFVHDADATRDFDFTPAESITYSVGEGAPDPATENHFIDAYNRNGGATVLGSPTTEVHRAWGYLVQDFPGATGYAGGIIMYNPYKNYAYYIHGAIQERYYNLGGPRATTDMEFELGPPVSDIEPYISSHGTQFMYQNFEGGALEHNVSTGAVFEIHGAIFAKWSALGYADDELGLVTSDEQDAALSPIGTDGRVSDFEGGHIHWHRTGGHGGHGGTAYETHGAIDAVYCAEGGSGGWLGFPVSDECVNPSGYPQSDFEGGYITTTDGANYYAYMHDDTEGPALEITSPDDGFHTDEYRIEISGTASDDSGILDDEVCIMVVSDGLDHCPIYSAPCNPTTRIWSVTIPVRCGDNEIRVWTWDNKHNRAEKTISVYCNPPDFSFAHITDAHIDDDCKPKMMDQFPYLPYLYCESQEKFRDTLREVNSKKPAFILDTGDCVEYDNEELFRTYMGLLDQCIDKDIGIYHTSGNHDRRTEFIPIPLSLPSNTDLTNYTTIVKHRKSEGSSNVAVLEDGYDDYYFEHGGYRFIGLESGEDYSQWWEVPPFTPEGSGLKSNQMNKSKEMDINIPKIVFMHHPVINEGDDTSGDPLVLNHCPEYGGNDECIAFNRCEFIKYCTDYNVQLVLTGHTHKPYDVTVSNTRFIQTPSATKDKKGQWGVVPLDVVISKSGYRMIYIKNGKAYPLIYYSACIIWNFCVNRLFNS